ncbi:MFS transporter [Aquihabitans sp. G128]|uniref:MFS transporter n=1 Tax=Aquihabitans sp. G128 TaxID=2849779 RepID=UPI001C22E26D|nr:MFS transporter [Aquihabitans sp. G128]QXC63066.1 MFS transporter [Aquihabitans sp. G128]
MTAPDPAPAAAPERLLTPTFGVIVVSAMAYFTAMGMLLPVLPRYVTDELDGNGFEVGLAVGAFAVSAALVRPLVGRLGDQLGRRPLAVAGSALAAISIAGYGLVPSLVALVAFRLVTGLGEAAFFVGAATAAQDLSPDDRRGEAASFFSISIYTGLAVGPFLGEVLYRSGGAGRVWLVSAVLAGLGALAALLIPAALGRRVGPAPTGPRTFLHPAAIMPGTILLLGLVGFAAFSSFLSLHLEGLGIDDAGPFFLVYGVTVLLVRIFGARLPDRLGAIRTTTISLVSIFVAMVAIASVSAAPVIYAATVVFSLGMALLFPALFGLVVEQAPEAERSHAVGTFSLFFDLSQGLGAPVLGIFVTVTGTDRAAFVVGAVVAVASLLVARARLPRPGDPDLEPSPALAT